MILLRPERARTDAELSALEPEWAALWQRARATPFQHPAWLLPWWRVFGTGAPRAAMLRAEDGTLLGLLPLYDLAQERKILPLGVGVSDYCDALIDPAAPEDAPTALLEAALSDAVLPCHLPELAPDAVMCRATAPAGWRAEEYSGQPSPVLLPGCVPARQLRKLRMARHRAARIGGFEVLIGGPTLFSDLIRLHEERWAGHGVLSDARARAFHSAALPGLAEAALLRVRGLRFRRQIVAVIYALQSDTRLFFYLSGFDAALAFQSPGTILLGSMIEEALAEGATGLHFLRGGEAYKYAWGAVDRYNLTRVFQPS